MSIKLCKDCINFRRDTVEWSSMEYAEKYATCYLTAKVIETDGVRCHIRRDTSAFGIEWGCGPSGKQWVAK